MSIVLDSDVNREDKTEGKVQNVLIVFDIFNLLIVSCIYIYCLTYIPDLNSKTSFSHHELKKGTCGEICLKLIATFLFRFLMYIFG